MLTRRTALTGAAVMLPTATMAKELTGPDAELATLAERLPELQQREQETGRLSEASRNVLFAWQRSNPAPDGYAEHATREAWREREAAARAACNFDAFEAAFVAAMGAVTLLCNEAATIRPRTQAGLQIKAKFAVISDAVADSLIEDILSGEIT
jgi:hypothetical protein